LPTCKRLFAASGEVDVFLSKSTGKTYHRSDYDEAPLPDDLPDESDESDDYLRIPPGKSSIWGRG
jgi:hypothetical protein